MNSPLKYYLIFVMFSLIMAGLINPTYGQIVYLPETGVDDAISPGEYDPLSGEERNVALSDDELEFRIQRSLEISPFVNGNTITVRVDYGTAILSGNVKDRDAMMEAVETAYNSGVVNVKNRLRIRDPKINHG